MAVGVIFEAFYICLTFTFIPIYQEQTRCV